MSGEFGIQQAGEDRDMSWVVNLGYNKLEKRWRHELCGEFGIEQAGEDRDMSWVVDLG